jgi:hypothetical protein
MIQLGEMQGSEVQSQSYMLKGILSKSREVYINV